MTRSEWLTKQHLVISARIDELEAERKTNRSAEHKALLVELKKQRLRLKEELFTLRYDSSEGEST